MRIVKVARLAPYFDARLGSILGKDLGESEGTAYSTSTFTHGIRLDIHILLVSFFTQASITSSLGGNRAA